MCVPWYHRRDVLWTLSQQQPIKPRCCFDERPQPFAVNVQFCASLEHISHARAEHTFPLPCNPSFVIPRQGFIPVRVREEASIGSSSPHLVPHALSPKLRVTVVTRWRHLR